MSKLAPRESYDGEKTLTAVKRHILEARRSRDISSQDAREEWELVEYHSPIDSEYHFALWHQDTKLDLSWSDFYHTSHDSDAIGFVTKAFPRIQAAIRAELEAEKAAAA